MLCGETAGRHEPPEGEPLSGHSPRGYVLQSHSLTECYFIVVHSWFLTLYISKVCCLRFQLKCNAVNSGPHVLDA